MRFVPALALLLIAPLGPLPVASATNGALPPPPADIAGLTDDLLACARAEGLLDSPRADAATVTVVDFRLPSTEKRLWVLAEGSGKVLFHEHVAHGKNTGEDEARDFSNVPGSNQSSLGLYRTAETYTGKHGHSLRLDGLEPGFNDRARERAIVMHGADYVSEEFVERVGRLGRSFGCPAVPADVSDAVIDTIAGGQPLLVFADDGDWRTGSPLLRCAESR